MQVVAFVCCLDVHYVAVLAPNKTPKITTTRALRQKVKKAMEARATGNLLSGRAFWMRKYLYNPTDINGGSANPVVDLHEGRKTHRPPI
jgi:hypothetical protein